MRHWLGIHFPNLRPLGIESGDGVTPCAGTGCHHAARWGYPSGRARPSVGRRLDWQHCQMIDADRLWGGSVTDLRVDLNERFVELDVQVNEGGDWKAYTVVMLEVSELRVDRPDPNPWYFSELTEVHISEDGGNTTVEFVLWNEPNGITIRCKEIAMEQQAANP